MKENIVLIGMPGVGKSTVGVILAKLMGYQFIDADLVIQDRENKLLKEIIAEKGIDGFIQVENDVNKSLNPKKAIISTGRKRSVRQGSNGTFVRNCNCCIFRA